MTENISLWTKLNVRRNLKIAGVIGFAAFVLFSARPFYVQLMRKEYEEVGREAFRLRHPDLQIVPSRRIRKDPEAKE
jgi:hypothetical protein